MASASRLRWLIDEIEKGRNAFVTMSCNHATGREKVSFSLTDGYMDAPCMRPAVSCALKMLSDAIQYLIVSDKGHTSHSKNKSVVEFWIELPKNAFVEVSHGEAKHNKLNVSADVFVPAASTSLPSDASPTLVGTWKSLPAPDWTVIHKRFIHRDALLALNGKLDFCEAMMGRREMLRNLLHPCEGTTWATELSAMMRNASATCLDLDGLPRSHPNLLSHYEKIFDACESWEAFVNRLTEAELLIACYPRRLRRKRYCFVRPADLAECHYSPLGLAEVLAGLDPANKSLWESCIRERYRYNHVWMSQREIAGIDPYYLIQQLRPADRIFVDHGIHQLMTSEH
eukprot:TRINITY_DN4109_c0_g1_i1.p1 TRINITY_DN4109_c0_g1~~TRINITY_DN4109_c0_g1_i1.p1  ORF type:complete len:359 (-),score=24.66 TRINITY_DN4109_c0_g1_i1:118-1143(-)